MRLDTMGRKIPKRTKEWRENISKSLDKKYVETCQLCSNKFLCHRYRKGIVRYCSRKCAKIVAKGKEIKKSQKVKVKYSGIHMWVRRYLPAKECSSCGATKYLHRANISGKYLRDINDWRVLCPSCHSEFDGKNKILKSDVERIIGLRKVGMTFNQIADEYGVTRKAISKRYYQAIKK